MPADPIGFHEIPARRLRLWADMRAISSARYVEEMERREKAANAFAEVRETNAEPQAADPVLESLLEDLALVPDEDPLPSEARSLFAFHDAVIAVLAVTAFILLAYLVFDVIPSIMMVAITGERP